MKYYRVKPEYDGKQLYKRGHKSGVKIPNGYSLIAHELLTEKEAEKLNVPQTCVDPVNVKKSQVYICFGARFEEENSGIAAGFMNLRSEQLVSVVDKLQKAISDGNKQIKIMY